MLLYWPFIQWAETQPFLSRGLQDEILDRCCLNSINLVSFERAKTGSEQVFACSGNSCPLVKAVFVCCFNSGKSSVCLLFWIMSRLFLSHRMCSRCFLLAKRESPLFTERAGARGSLQKAHRGFVQTQQKQLGLALFKTRNKSKIWICGVGMGIVLAVGLKYSVDSADSSCEEQINKASSYGEAIKVSRDLLERIKVGSEVGLQKNCFIFP